MEELIISIVIKISTVEVRIGLLELLMTEPVDIRVKWGRYRLKRYFNLQYFFAATEIL